MAKDRVETQLQSLKALRGRELTAEVLGALTNALRDRVNVVVAKAAQISGEMEAAALLPEMKNAFERLFEKDKDPQCWGKNALAKALKDLGLQESTVFLRGVRHVQLEPVWGGQEDTATVLRGACALALVQCNDITRDETFRCLVEALVDKKEPVRMDAANALEQMGGPEAILLLRLKARMGDKDPRVTGQVLEGLLHLEPNAALPFVAEFLDVKDEEIQDEAALALGASRLPEAFELLKEAWDKAAGKRPALLLRAISLSRLAAAIEFLIDLVRQGRPREAEEALHELELHKDTEKVVRQIAEAVAERGDAKLNGIFQQRFTME
jgi:hypothetical protein